MHSMKDLTVTFIYSNVEDVAGAVMHIHDAWTLSLSLS